MRSCLAISLLSLLLLLLLNDVHSAPQHIGSLLRNTSLDDSELDVPAFEFERTRTTETTIDTKTELTLTNDKNARDSLSEHVGEDNSPTTSSQFTETFSETYFRPGNDGIINEASDESVTGKVIREPFSTDSTENTESHILSSENDAADASFKSHFENGTEESNNKIITIERNTSNSFPTTLTYSSDASTTDSIDSEVTISYDGENKDLRSDEPIFEKEIEEKYETVSPDTASEINLSLKNLNVSEKLVLESEEFYNNSQEIPNENLTTGNLTDEGENSTPSNSATTSTRVFEFRNDNLDILTTTSGEKEGIHTTEKATSSSGSENGNLTSDIFRSDSIVVGLHDSIPLDETTFDVTTLDSESKNQQTSPSSGDPTTSDNFEDKIARPSSLPPNLLDELTDKETQGYEGPETSDAAMTKLDDDQLPFSSSASEEYPDSPFATADGDYSSPSSNDESSFAELKFTSEASTTLLGGKTTSPVSTEAQFSTHNSKPSTNGLVTTTGSDDVVSKTDDPELPSDSLDSELGKTNFPTSFSSTFGTTEGSGLLLNLKSADASSDTSELQSTTKYPPYDQTTATEGVSSTLYRESTVTTKEKTTPVWHGPTILPRQTTTTEIISKLSDTEPPPLKVEEMKEDNDDDSSLEIRHSNRYLSGNNTDMVAAVQFLHYHDKASSEQCFKLVDAHWNYATNLTEENKRRQLEQTLEYSLFHKEAWKNATSFAWKSFNDTLLKRWFKSLSILGNAALPEEQLTEFNQLKAEMKNTYSTAKVCPYVKPADQKGPSADVEEIKCSLSLEPDLQSILVKSRDYDELVHVWKAWRDAAGKPIREKFLRFVKLSNEAARLNGFPDTGDMWREAYESDSFQQNLDLLWEQLRPLYEHLHAYVRRKLIQQYGSDKIQEDGPVPAHLLGNMWAQSWVSLLDITQPFPGKPSVDVTSTMETKNMTALEMFKISEEFFTSLGLKPMPEEFWKYSLIEKPKDRDIICHASAWDFCNGKDYRIKQCTDITMEDLITVHHEMGHIQYFLQYARQPNVFREGANPGFHEAIGDVLALSVSTPKHLLSIGLLDEIADDPEGDLNFLLRTALEKVSFLPSGYLIDLWRWGLFSGEIKYEEMNSKWWELRLKYQGICPPVKRTEEDFDPGAKYHVAGNVPYIRYFVSFVIQFQFHKVLCDAAGHTGPLYKCDIYRSKEAGLILSQVMELGSSEHWSEAMRIMTGGTQTKMDAQPIMEYFEPLLNWLIEQNQNETLGWRSSDATVCP